VLLSAFEVLKLHDVVVGPTHDGGYYLVGANAVHRTLFNSVGMGTKNALECLVARARELELSVGFTDSFYDIDVHSDLALLAAELRLVPAKAPRTAAWLKAWKNQLLGRSWARSPREAHDIAQALRTRRYHVGGSQHLRTQLGQNG